MCAVCRTIFTKSAAIKTTLQKALKEHYAFLPDEFQFTTIFSFSEDFKDITYNPQTNNIDLTQELPKIFVHKIA